MELYKPEEMADLVLALASGVTVHIDAQGYRRGDGVPVYAEDVSELKSRHQVRPASDNSRLELTMEGLEVSRLGRDALISRYGQSTNQRERI